MRKILTLAAALLLTASLTYAQLGTTQVTNNLTVAPVAEAALTIGTSATTLSSSGTNFSDYTGTTPFTYFIRTTQSGGTGTIDLKVTTDFSTGTGGAPSVGNPPDPSDTLKYTATVSAPGTAASGSQTASTAATSPVASFGANAHSVKAGNSASVAWDLSNDPLYPTGSYTATVTFTIAAT
jgi:hypothetical protein